MEQEARSVPVLAQSHLRGQTLIKPGESVPQAAVAQGFFPGCRQSLFD